MRFVYARRGGPLLDWSGPTPPSPTRAGETRSLGDFYPTTRNSNAMRRYSAGYSAFPGSAVGYEYNRALGELNVPRPGAPEVVSGYESPQPGAAIVHLGGYMPEGAARGYGQTMLSADAPASKPFDMGIVRKASALAAAYHGVRRNNGSILWGLVWAVAAFVSPLYGTLVPAFALAQGFGEPRPKSNPARTKRKYRWVTIKRKNKYHRKVRKLLPVTKGTRKRKRKSNPARLKAGQYGPVYRRPKKAKRKQVAATLRRRVMSRRRRMHGRR